MLENLCIKSRFNLVSLIHGFCVESKQPSRQFLGPLRHKKDLEWRHPDKNIIYRLLRWLKL